MNTQTHKTQVKSFILILLFSHLFFAGFSQQVVTISINQPGVENCYATAVDETIQDYSFKIFPNPADEKFTVEINQSPANKTFKISLLNIVGQTLFLSEEKSTNGMLKKEFDISGITGGIYFLKIDANEFKTSQKILINSKK